MLNTRPDMSGMAVGVSVVHYILSLKLHLRGLLSTLILSISNDVESCAFAYFLCCIFSLCCLISNSGLKVPYLSFGLQQTLLGFNLVIH